MTVCCGPSGSGKSSLALDTIYAEGQRRYVESLSAYARQFLGPDAEAEGRARQRPVAGHQHRAEDDQQEPALDGRHGHRDLRLPAHPVRPAGPAVLPELRHRRSARRRPTRSSTRSCACRRGRKLYLMAPVERRGQEKYEALWDEMRRSGLRPGARRRPVVQRRGAAGHRPSPQAPGRGGGRSGGRARRTSAAGSPTRSRRPWTWAAASCTSPTSTTSRASQLAGRPLQPALRLRPLRPQLRAAQSAPLLLQQPARLVPGLRGPGQSSKERSPALLIRDAQLTLREGAVAAWPALRRWQPVSACSRRRWQTMSDSRSTRRSTSSTPAHQRAILHGTGDAWIKVSPSPMLVQSPKSKVQSRMRGPRTLGLGLGLFVPVQGAVPGDRGGGAGQFVLSAPAGSPRQRGRLLDMQRLALRDDAAAFRFAGRTLGEICACRSARSLTSSRS